MGMATNAARKLEIDDDVADGLRRLAERKSADASRLANEALRDLIRYEDELSASIARGLDDIKAGRVKNTAELKQRLEERRRRAGR